MKKQFISLTLLISCLFGEDIVNSENSKKINSDTLNICKQCHGLHWEKEALGKSKDVSNMTNEEVKVALLGYKDGSYGGIMKNIMKNHLKDFDTKDLIEISQKIKPLVDPYIDK